MNESDFAEQLGKCIVRHDLTVTTMTRELFQTANLLELVETESAYQIMGSAPDSLVYNPEDVLLALLPATSGMLLDVALPFYYSQSDGVMRYFARYLLMGKTLIGIRIRVNENELNPWPRRKCVQYQVPTRFVKAYRRMNMQVGPEHLSVPLGEFILSFQYCKIGILFESQILADRSVLDDYHIYGCDIFSIINDVHISDTLSQRLTTSYHPYYGNSRIQTILRKFAEQENVIILYCGNQIAPSFKRIYLSQSFILEGDKIQRKRTDMFRAGLVLTVTCDLLRVKQHKRYPFARRQLEGITEYNFKQSLKLSTKPFWSATSRETGVQFCEPTSRIINGDLRLTLHVWYLYQHINQRECFILPVPFGPRCRKLYEHIYIICEHLQIPLKELVMLYRAQHSHMPRTGQDSLFTGYQIFDELVGNLTDKNLYFYSDNDSQVQFLKQRCLFHSNWILCHILLPSEASEQQLRRVGQQQTRLVQFCEEMLRQNDLRMQRFMSQSKCSKYNFSHLELTDVFNHILPKITRTQVVLSSFHLYVLRARQNELLIALAEAEANLSKDKLIGQEIKTNVLPTSVTEDQVLLSQRLKQIKLQKQAQAIKRMVLCHCCGVAVTLSNGHSCANCRRFNCLFCIYQHNLSASRLSQLSICIVCSKQCCCRECKKENSLTSEADRTYTIDFLPQSSYNQQCLSCLLNERKLRNIKVQCKTCLVYYCLQCMQQNRKNPIDFTHLFSCQDCSFKLAREKERSSLLIADICSAEECEDHQEKIEQHRLNLLRRDFIDSDLSSNKFEEKKRQRAQSNSAESEKRSNRGTGEGGQHSQRGEHSESRYSATNGKDSFRQRCRGRGREQGRGRDRGTGDHKGHEQTVRTSNYPNIQHSQTGRQLISGPLSNSHKHQKQGPISTRACLWRNEDKINPVVTKEVILPQSPAQSDCEPGEIRQQTLPTRAKKIQQEVFDY